jgi:hypothetical protein
MDDQEDEMLLAMVNDLDEVILKYQDEFQPHNIAGVLLSRITLLMQTDPATGKDLLRFVWEKLDELEQNNPGKYL